MVWERRWHPLREEWVTITSHRNTRPWSGSEVNSNESELPDYEADCFLCPGNRRISDKLNDNYESIFVFDNDHPSFSLNASLDAGPTSGLYERAPATGVTRVVCYTPKHNLTLAELDEYTLVNLIDCWAEQTYELASLDEVNHVFIFENKGEVVGVSNPHPHCQIYATSFVFKTIEVELNAIQNYRVKENKSLFAMIIENESKSANRVLSESNDTIAFVPYFARFPYESYIAPKKTHQFIYELDSQERRSLARALKEVLVKYDNLWQISFPYVLVLHQAPCDGNTYPDYHFHIQIHPPLRQAGLQKYLAGTELGGGTFLNDACPEDTAAELRSQGQIHYKQVSDR